MRAAWLLVGNLLPVFTAYSLSIPSYGSASGVVADVGASECNPIVTLDKGHRHFESYKGRNEADGGHPVNSSPSLHTVVPGAQESSESLTHPRPTTNNEPADLDARPSSSENLPIHTGMEGKMNKEKDSAGSLVELWATFVIIPTSALVAYAFHKQGFNHGLLSGAAIADAFLLQIQKDQRTSTILLLTVAGTYMIFHVMFCYRVVQSLNCGEGYVAATVILTGVIAIPLVHIPALATKLHDNSGWASLAFLLGLHLIAVWLTSVGMRFLRRYLKARKDSRHELPLYRQDQVSGRAPTEAPDSRQPHRVNLSAQSSAVH